MYRDILALVESGSHTEGQAVDAGAGLQFRPAGRHRVAQLEIPDRIVRAQAPLSSRALRPPLNRREWMQQVTAFSAEAALLMPALGRRRQRGLCQPLLAASAARCNLDQDKLDLLFEQRRRGNPQPAREHRIGAACGRVRALAGDGGRGLPRELLLASPLAAGGAEREAATPAASR